MFQGVSSLDFPLKPEVLFVAPVLTFGRERCFMMSNSTCMRFLAPGSNWVVFSSHSLQIKMLYTHLEDLGGTGAATRASRGRHLDCLALGKVVLARVWTSTGDLSLRGSLAIRQELLPSLSTSSPPKQPMHFPAMYSEFLVEMMLTVHLVMSASAHHSFRL